ncbi:helix-turn-helix domain-containing protein [Siminovitchia fortis]|uniref:helix-turn-helix domain-containing protein n=1 Tax=Siminovitchia fortis TaxID=254758 RepID=UPI0011A1C617|nr:helix-turn-helix transcriptional regulator [Siminovitchia fortis]
MDIFKERLKDLRIEHGYKQEEIAKKLNVTTSAYGYYEQGRNEPSLETLYKIAQFYQVSVDYLLGIINTPNHPVYYSFSEDVTLTESEWLAVKEMKKSSFLEEIGQQPNFNVNRLNRYWKFIKEEHNNNNNGT